MERTKDIAYICSRLFELKILRGNVNENFDKIFSIAQKFVDNPPKGFAWGEGLDDEYIYDFAFKNIEL